MAAGRAPQTENGPAGYAEVTLTPVRVQMSFAYE